MIKDEKQDRRVAVYVDGSNFYHKLKDLGIKNCTYYKYGALANHLARGRDVIGKRYYIGVIRAKAGDARAKKMQENQVNLFNHLGSKQERFSVQRGFLMKNDGVFHEKGVDVKMAVDILVGAYEDLYDTAILLSSDTDLIPAIEKARLLGKRVEYIGFSHKPSYGLV